VLAAANAALHVAAVVVHVPSSPCERDRAAAHCSLDAMSADAFSGAGHDGVNSMAVMLALSAVINLSCCDSMRCSASSVDSHVCSDAVSTSTVDGAEALHGGSGPLGPVDGTAGMAVDDGVQVTGGRPVEVPVAVLDGDAPVETEGVGVAEADPTDAEHDDSADDSADALLWHTVKLARKVASSAAHDKEALGVAVVEGDVPGGRGEAVMDGVPDREPVVLAVPDTDGELPAVDAAVPAAAPHEAAADADGHAQAGQADGAADAEGQGEGVGRPADSTAICASRAARAARSAVTF